MVKKKKKWTVYCLSSLNPQKPNHTYVGMTNNFKRRHRQHNGEIKGGARYTTRFGHGPWKTLFKIKGMKTKGEALSFEKLMKTRRKGRGGPSGRCQTLEYLLRELKITPTPKSPPIQNLRINFYGTKDLYIQLSKKKSEQLERVPRKYKI